MPSELTSKNSEYNQSSFIGGMNLLLDDTHLSSNQYRIGFNLRNRYDRLDTINKCTKDTLFPKGIIQEVTTFGKYLIAFVSGKAYYRYYLSSGWISIANFSMSTTAPRYWTVSVPVATTNYLRIAATGSSTSLANSRGSVNVNQVAGASQGNLPGLLVQDGINQPRFIFLNSANIPTCKTTQTFDEWHITFTDERNIVVAEDMREYVPVGTLMAYVDGILYIAKVGGQYIYRSVEGRPLDFVINVVNTLATDEPYIQIGGGDADTTAYSVGVGPITCLRGLSDGSLFVGAGNANFSVSKNMSNVAPMIFGEYTFIRKFLFNANCLSDRAIIDTLGDTRFIDLTGVRSFNAIAQTMNEGRNTVFTATIQPAFSFKDNNTKKEYVIIQDAAYSAAILYNNYELYAMDSIFGPIIAVYDTLNNCWSAFDTNQTGEKRIKQFVKIDLDILAIYAVTEDNCLYKLYDDAGTDNALVRTVGVCANILYANENVKMANPKNEIKPIKTRIIMKNITEDCTCSITHYVNNRISKIGKQSKLITYTAPEVKTTGLLSLSDVDHQMNNLLFSTPDCEQGWEVFGAVEWSGGSITQFSMELLDLTPNNPLNSQDI